MICKREYKDDYPSGKGPVRFLKNEHYKIGIDYMNSIAIISEDGYKVTFSKDKKDKTYPYVKDYFY